jgi:membrane-associated phospholipid phosphatase
MFIFLDYIGVYGPVLTTALTFVTLLNRYYYLIAFIGGTIVNVYMNGVLKDYFREPRPPGQIPFNNETLKGIHVYGFPSGHSQIASFAFAFLYWANGPPAVLYSMFFIWFLTLYQRWKYRRHTIKQLFFGAVFGVFVAWFSVYFTKRAILTVDLERSSPLFLFRPLKI